MPLIDCHTVTLKYQTSSVRFRAVLSRRGALATSMALRITTMLVFLLLVTITTSAVAAASTRSHGVKPDNIRFLTSLERSAHRHYLSGCGPLAARWDRNLRLRRRTATVTPTGSGTTASVTSPTRSSPAGSSSSHYGSSSPTGRLGIQRRRQAGRMNATGSGVRMSSRAVSVFMNGSILKSAASQSRSGSVARRILQVKLNLPQCRCLESTMNVVTAQFDQ